MCDLSPPLIPSFPLGKRDTEDSNSVDISPSTPAPTPTLSEAPDPCSAKLDAIMLGKIATSFKVSFVSTHPKNFE